MTISIVPCTDCGVNILIWDASPTPLCHRCEQKQIKHERGGLGRWAGV
ncbi:MAG: hypothetical protein WA977_08520 [Halobacteriota archaeon]